MPNFLFLASLNLFAAVSLGAFGAHGLKARLSAEQLAWWHTAVNYQVWHALGMFGVGLLMLSPALTANAHAGALKNPAYLFQAGILIFSGSLYAMSLGAPRWFGAITPIGGAAFLLGWAWLAWICFRINTP